MYLMIVEDEQFIRKGIRDLLGSIKKISRIEEACDGDEAWKKIMESGLFPDILITDIRMPGMDGLELSENVRRHSRATKVIFISGYEDFVYAKKAIHIGASGYITKPIDQNELIELTEMLIHEIEMEDQQSRQLELTHFYEETQEEMLRVLMNRVISDPGSVSLKSLSEEWNCSPAYISILFKEQTGYNFKDYLLDCKMKKAKELLASNKDAGEICNILGYSDYDYFSKIFKKYFRESPTEYKKRHNIK